MKVAYHGQEHEIEGPMTVRDLFDALGLDPDLLLAVRGRQILLLDDVLADEDEVELIDAIAGG